MITPDAAKLSAAVSAFGAAAKTTLNNAAIAGQPEDQLRTPLVGLFKALAPLTGLAGNDTELVGETRLADLMIRPDFAVTRKGALIGFIEVKAPAKGADPTKFRDKHDKEQWEKLKALPNLILLREAARSPRSDFVIQGSDGPTSITRCHRNTMN